MVYDPSATTETFTSDPRDASNMAKVILSTNSVAASPEAFSKLDEILDRRDMLETQVAGTLGEKLWDEVQAAR